MTSEPFSEWKKNLAEFKPPVSIEQARACFRRNVEAGTDFVQGLAESAQAIAARQGEIFRSNAEHAMKASKEFLEGASQGDLLARQADIFKNVMENNISHMREISEMAVKASREAFDRLGKCAAEQMKEFKSAPGAAAPTPPKKKAA